MLDIDINPYNQEERISWGTRKTEGFNIFEYNVVILDGGNICKTFGEGKEIGDDIADYVDNGGISFYLFTCFILFIFLLFIFYLFYFFIIYFLFYLLFLFYLFYIYFIYFYIYFIIFYLFTFFYFIFFFIFSHFLFYLFEIKEMLLQLVMQTLKMQNMLLRGDGTFIKFIFHFTIIYFLKKK